MKTTSLMEELLKIVHRGVYGGISFDPGESYTDDYDKKYMFPDIFRGARLSELLMELEKPELQFWRTPIGMLNAMIRMKIGRQ